MASIVSQLIEGGYLALWGVSLLLAWVATLRLINFAHVAMAERGWVKRPRVLMLPMQSWRDPAVALVALLCGAAGLIAFVVAASRAIHLPVWLMPLALPPAAELARITFSYCVLTFFVARVAEHPVFKIKWIAGWTAFAMWLAWMT